MNALLFPGQGSQSVGMGQVLYEALPEAKVVLDRANEVLGYDLRALMFEGPLEKLTDTRFTQPAIFTCNAMYLAKVRSDGIDYDFVAGHSLGEYDALLAANVFDFEIGLRLVQKRGEAMGRMNGKGTMAAVLGLSEEELRPYLNEGVVMANLNSRTQIVISGDEASVEAVGILCHPALFELQGEEAHGADKQSHHGGREDHLHVVGHAGDVARGESHERRRHGDEGADESEHRSQFGQQA